MNSRRRVLEVTSRRYSLSHRTHCDTRIHTSIRINTNNNIHQYRIETTRIRTPRSYSENQRDQRDRERELTGNVTGRLDCEVSSGLVWSGLVWREREREEDEEEEEPKSPTLYCMCVCDCEVGSVCALSYYYREDPWRCFLLLFIVLSFTIPSLLPNTPITLTVPPVVFITSLSSPTHCRLITSMPFLYLLNYYSNRLFLCAVALIIINITYEYDQTRKKLIHSLKFATNNINREGDRGEKKTEMA